MSAENEIRNIKLFEEEIRNIKQMAFDAAHPVNETYTQYPQQDDPMTLYNKNGVTSIWQQQTQYSGAFFRSSNAPTAVYKNDDETDYYIQDSVTGELIAIQAASSGGPTIADSPSGEAIWYKGKEYKRYVVTASTRYANRYIDKTNSLVIQDNQNKSHKHTFSGTRVQAGTGLMTHQNLADRYRQSPFTQTSTTSAQAGGIQTNPVMNSDTAYRIGLDYTPGGTIENDGDNESRPDNYTMIIWKRIN